MKKMMLATLLVASGAALADDYIEQQMMSDSQFSQKRQQAIAKLEAKGYHVIEIDADDYRGRPVFEVDAVKDRQEYDIKLSYPDLEILVEKRDY